MSWLYRNVVRPALFRKDAEVAHEFTISRLAWVSRHPSLCRLTHAFLGAPELPVEVLGLRFPNPIGLAAGMDKAGAAVPAWAALGFGFSELGGVTWHAQPGNPKPRVFRAIPEEAVVNRMGFNNGGAEAFAEQLKTWRTADLWPAHPVGVNLGKSKVTPLEKAAEDYASTFRVLRPLADFFVVNVSSPNTPNLRQLQDKTALSEILAALQEINLGQPPSPSSPTTSAPKPILVKVAPDLSFEALDEILELVIPRKLAGIVATNTTISRPESQVDSVRKVYGETGGLSGRPLRMRSTGVIRHLWRQTRGSLPIIGVGGISSVDDAWEKIVSGACLLQIYTGLVYEGPALTSRLVRGLQSRLQEHGFKHPLQAVGTDVPA